MPLDKNLTWPYPTVFAHRGGGTLAPENTLAAMQEGYRRNYRAVEFDVMLSADEVPMLMHDAHFGRTIRGTGNTAKHTALQLQAMDAGAWFGEAFINEPVPYFDAIVRYCVQQSIVMNIEIKPSPGADHKTGQVVANQLARLTDELPVLRSPTLRPLVSSFSGDALGSFRAFDRLATQCGYLFDRIPSNWQQVLESLDCQALHCNWKHLTPAIAEAIKTAGYWLFCYTVNDPAKASMLLQMGVDGFCTDCLDLFEPT